MTSPAPQQDQSVLAYKLNQVEREVELLRGQLHLYVTARENELQLRSIQDAVSRIEREMGEVKKQVGDVDTKLIAQREALDKLQIKVLWGIVAVVLSVLMALFIAYVTHLFHERIDMQYKKLRAYACAGLVTMIVLLLLLVAFQSIWVTHGSATSLMNEVGLQRTRNQRIVKDVLILAYRSSSEERTQALSELQMMLPRFQQTQAGLQAGDSSLGLPKRPPQDIQVLLIQSQLDYVSLLNAAKTILAQPQHVDPAQVQVVLDHERGYTQMMNNVVTLWDQHIDDAFQDLFFIESGFVAALLVVVCLIYFAVTRRTLALLERQEAPKQVQELPLSLPQELKPVQVQVAQAQIDTPREGS